MTGTDNHALFRVVNEEICRLAEGFGVDEVLELVCECEQGDCFARLSVRRSEYEAVGRFSTRFLTRPDHVGAGERVVRETSGYAVVEQAGALVGGETR